MVIMPYTYRVKPALAQAVHILYQEWKKENCKARLISAELFTDIHDPNEMILLARFPDEEAAWIFAESAEHHAWYAQLSRMTEEGPAVSQYRDAQWEQKES